MGQKDPVLKFFSTSSQVPVAKAGIHDHSKITDTKYNRKSSIVFLKRSKIPNMPKFSEFPGNTGIKLALPEKQD